MSEDGNSRVQQLFLDALEVPAGERDAWLAAQCGDDCQLLDEVQSLLSHDRCQHDPLEGPLKDAISEDLHGLLSEAASVLNSSGRESIGGVIGPYTIRQMLGEGGFGAVYLAVQTHPVRRKVALKIIKPGMDSKECIARFEAERQALALMDHPNIANVLEAGTTTTGYPYFVMELVRGVPITEFCDARHLPLEERLKLFVSVCRAVQHAHQKGIIHRDLKPSNVLVAEHAGQSVVKVIDFGIAKALGQQLTEKTLFTNFGQMVGTPSYMSPEQAAMNVMDVDTRSDIYSLGVLLYELMTGRTPIDKQRMNEAALEEVRRIIREEDPPSLSRRLSTLEAAELSSISELRGLTPRRLLGLFHGELDWIAMKALEKDPTRRYETAGSFVADIECYLTSQPVEARPASSWYRFRKFVVRHKAGTAATAIVAFGLIAAVAGLIVSNQLIAKERDVKKQALVDREAALHESRRHEQQARANAELAQANEERAKINAERAEANAALAERERDDKARQLYLAHMNVAQQEWNNNNADRTRELLDLYLPGNHSGNDYRDWEWNYLWRVSHAELQKIDPSPHDSLETSSDPDAEITLVFSPDGRFLLTGSNHGILRVRTPNGTKDLLSIRPHQQRILRLGVSADGKLVATAGADAKVKLWNTADWTEFRVFPGHYNDGYGMSLSPLGDRIAVGFNEIVIYDTADGREIGRLKGHPARVRHLQFSTDGRQLVSSGDDGTTRLWDVKTGEELHRLNMGPAIAMSPDGRTLVTGDRKGNIAFWDCTSGQQVALSKPHMAEVTRIAFSANGSRIVTVGADTEVHMINVNDRRVIHSFRGHGAIVTDVAFSQDMEMVASCGWDCTIRLWDTASRDELIQSGPGHVDGLVFSPDNEFLAVGSWTQLMVFEAVSRRLVWEMDEETYLARWSCPMSFDQTGQLLATGRKDGSVRVRDARTGDLIKKLQAHNSAITSLLFLPDGRMVTGDGTGEVVIWSTIQDGFHELNRVAIVKGAVGSLAVSPNGRMLAVGGGESDIVVQLWDLIRNKPLQTLTGHQGYSHTLIFSRDGQQLSCGARDSHLTCWELPTGNVVRRRRAHSDSVWAASLSPNGRRLATCSDDGTVKVWDEETGMEVITLKPALGETRSLSFSPDGYKLAVGGHERGFVIYDSRPLSPDIRAEPWVTKLTKDIQVTDFMTEGKLREAITVFEQIATVQRQKTDHDALRDLYARTLQWEQALKANQVVQNGKDNWQQVALLYQAGRHDEYRQARQRLLGNSDRIDQGWEIHLYLVATLLLPLEPEQEESVRRLANALLTSQQPWERDMVGKAMYRLGEFGRWYAELPDNSQLKSGCELLRAMSEFNTEQSDENRQKLEQMIKRQEDYARSRIENGNIEKYWHNYIEAMAWAQEAKRVLNDDRP